MKELHSGPGTAELQLGSSSSLCRAEFFRCAFRPRPITPLKGRLIRFDVVLGLEYWTKGDEVMKKSEGRVRLADYIQHLRQELTTAAKEGEGEELRFAVEEIEVELDVTMSQESSTEGGWDHWVVLKIGASDNKTISQKMRLKLKPLRGDAAKEAEESGVITLSDER